MCARPRQHDPGVDQSVVEEISRGVAAETGEAFLDALVRHLAGALKVHSAWVTEWDPEHSSLTALSFWSRGRYVCDYRYAVSGTPCEAVIREQRLVVVPDRVVELYPDDPDLAPLAAVSYMGLPLRDTDGRLLGNLAVLDDRPLAIDATREAVFAIFGARAAAELGRLRRDRALRDSERALARIVDGVMDAIVEFDADLRVTRINRAATSCFALDAEPAAELSLARLFTGATCTRLGELSQRLCQAPEAGEALWIGEGLTGRGAGGRTFPAEATLSHLQVEGRDFFMLVLRDVEERLAADSRLQSLSCETAALRAELETLRGDAGILGDSPPMHALLRDIARVAPSDASVLITGETGTGKELIARAIHRQSRRRDGPLVKLNCAAIPAALQESELFGHEKGAFTGATQRRQGRFELADGGTLFLDELGEMPLDLQAKLLRVLQDGEFEPVGGTRSVRVDVRVVGATHRDLEAMVATGGFRQDLLYRLNVFPLRAPALRERGDDVVSLAEAIAGRIAAREGATAAPLQPEDRVRLRAHDWPGNVRELENVIQRAWITGVDTPHGRILNLARALAQTGSAGACATSAAAVAGEAEAAVLTAAELAALERENLLRALERCRWKISGAGGAAELLDLHPNTLSSRMKSLRISRP